MRCVQCAVSVPARDALRAAGLQVVQVVQIVSVVQWTAAARVLGLNVQAGSFTRSTSASA